MNRMHPAPATLILGAAMALGALFGACSSDGKANNDASGTAGTTGGAGTSGAAGTTGAAGTNGGAGTNGAAGTTGAAGTNGGAGTNGAAGTSGAAGTTGAAGTNGAAGTTGAAGAGGRGGASATGGRGGASGAGGASGGRGGTGGTGGALATLTLTSSAFTEGGNIPATSTCSGVNTSPPFAWTAGPATTMSYAMVLTDTANNLVHWVLWDIPPATLSLPAALAADAMLASPAGAKQVSIATAGHAFSGPCPPAGTTHLYQFAIHALDVATLPTVTTTSTGATVKAQVLAHALASGTLSANGMR